MEFRPLSHSRKAVGKVIKASKNKDTWVFELNGSTYTVEYFASLRGNRRLFVNGQLHPADIDRGLVRECKFTLGDIPLEIVSTSVGGILYVDGKTFDEEYRDRYESYRGTHWGEVEDPAAQWKTQEDPLPAPTTPRIRTAKKPQEVDLISFEPVRAPTPLAPVDSNLPRRSLPAYPPVTWQQPMYPAYGFYPWRPSAQ